MITHLKFAFDFIAHLVFALEGEGDELVPDGALLLLDGGRLVVAPAPRPSQPVGIKTHQLGLLNCQFLVPLSSFKHLKDVIQNVA